MRLLATPAGEQSLPEDAGPVVDTPVAQRVVPDGGANSATPMDKSVLAIAAPRRVLAFSTHLNSAAAVWSLRYDAGLTAT